MDAADGKKTQMATDDVTYSIIFITRILYRLFREQQDRDRRCTITELITLKLAIDGCILRSDTS